MVKNLPVIQETGVQSLCQETPVEKEVATHSNILAQRIPWTKEPGELQSTGSLRVSTERVKLTFISKAIKWSKESFFKLGQLDTHMKSNEFRNRPYTFHKKLTQNGGFSGVPVVKTSLSNAGSVNSIIPGQGAKSPHVVAMVQLCPTLCDPKSCSKSGFPVLH